MNECLQQNNNQHQRVSKFSRGLEFREAIWGTIMRNEFRGI